MHACTHDGPVDELIMPLRRAACEPSHGSSLSPLLFLGHGGEPFQPVRQHDGQREEQDGGDEQELCESDAYVRPQRARGGDAKNRSCVSGERVPGLQRALVQLFVDHDVFEGGGRAPQSVSGELIDALRSRRGTYSPRVLQSAMQAVFVGSQSPRPLLFRFRARGQLDLVRS